MCLYAHPSLSDSKTGQTASKRRKGAKNSATAAKVALMKLKMHADGDQSLPQVGLGDSENKKVKHRRPLLLRPALGKQLTGTSRVSRPVRRGL